MRWKQNNKLTPGRYTLKHGAKGMGIQKVRERRRRCRVRSRGRYASKDTNRRFARQSSVSASRLFHAETVGGNERQVGDVAKKADSRAGDAPVDQARSVSALDFSRSLIHARRQHLVHAHYHETTVKRLKHSLHRNIAMRSERSAYCTLAIKFRAAANTITQTLDVKSIAVPSSRLLVTVISEDQRLDAEVAQSVVRAVQYRKQDGGADVSERKE